MGIIREMLDARMADQGRAYVKKTASEMARHLNVDENTIRTRMRKLQQSGFLRAWWMAINPTLVGQELYQVWFDVNRPSSKQDVIKKISLLSGVVVIKNFIGDSLSVMLYCEGGDGCRKNSALMTAIANSSEVVSVREPFPTPPIRLRENDLAIIKSLHKDPLKSHVQVARDLGLSSKTVKRRIEMLTDAHAIFLVASPNLKALEGGIMCSLLVFYKNNKPDSRDRVQREVLNQLASELIYAELDDSQHAYFSFLITNVARTEELVRWTEKLEGVASCRIDMMHEILTFRETLDEQVDKLLQMHPLQRKSMPVDARERRSEDFRPAKEPLPEKLAKKREERRK